MSLKDANPFISDDKTRYTNFCFVLYPDDEDHMNTLRYLLKFDAMYHVAYILHDRDVWSEEDYMENSNHVPGEHKKVHYHVLLNMKCQSTISGVQKHLMLNHVEKVDNVSFYLAYMLHQTPECIKANKPIYTMEEMKADKKFKTYLDNQNLYFIQLEEIGYYIRDNPLVKIEDVIAHINLMNDKSYIDMFDKYQHVIIKILDNRDRDLDRIYRRSHAMEVIAYNNSQEYLNDNDKVSAKYIMKQKQNDALKESFERVHPKNLEIIDNES